jgi:hypothetical protein
MEGLTASPTLPSCIAEYGVWDGGSGLRSAEGLYLQHRFSCEIGDIYIKY